MAPIAHTLDLAGLGLSPGQGRRLELSVTPGRLLAGADELAAVQGAVPARLDVSRMASGHAMRLRFAAPIEGPCVRCIEPAKVRVEVDAREVDRPGTDDEELASPYVSGDELDLAAWAHDSLALALPPQVLCRPDCAGLCPVCGESLNDADPRRHEHQREPDPRWAKLRELPLE